jgi:hypothetical protein
MDPETLTHALFILREQTDGDPERYARAVKELLADLDEGDE